jgi:hypothetical protein
VALMADDGGTVLARGEEVAAFIAVCKAVREVALRAKATKSWHGSRHGRSTARGGAATCGVYVGARLVGRRGAGMAALRPMDARHVAPRKRAGMAVPRRMDRRAEAGLGVRPSEVAARVARDAGATACALDARAKTISTNPL